MKRIANFAIGLTFACGTLFALSPQAWADATTTEPPRHVLVVAVASDQLSLDVTTAASTVCNLDVSCSMHLTVTDNVVKDQLKQLHKGDHIQIVYFADTKTPTDAKSAADTNHPPTVNKAAQTKTKDASKHANQQTPAPTPQVTTNSAAAQISPDPKNSVDAKTKYVLKAWCVDSVPVDPWPRTRALLGSAAALFLLTLIFSGFKPTQLIISEDNRYSNSRFQMALWFFVLITTYVAALWLRGLWTHWEFIGGVNIPNNLLLLTGMSAFTFAGAKAITSNKVAQAGAASKSPLSSPGNANFFRDLTHNDGTPASAAQPSVLAQPAVGNQPAIAAQLAVPAQGPGVPQFDFGDFQMLIVTLIAVATYLILVFNFLGTIEYSKIVTLPDVDTTLLATFGLGQGAYLTKKAVGNVGTS